MSTYPDPMTMMRRLAKPPPGRRQEWDGTRAGCVMHRKVVTWDPAPAWWHHGNDDTCPYLLSAPAPLPRDKPWIYGRYGQRGKPQSWSG